MQFQRVDRPYADERNDCAVRALSNATGMSYQRAHALFSAAGRRYRGRTRWDVSTPIYNRFGEMRFQRITVVEFARRHPVGTFIVHVRGHLFAVRDGVALDTHPPKPRQVIQHWWVMHRQPVELPAPVVEQENEPEEVPVVRTQQRQVLSPNAILARIQSLRIAT
jgi:hypothetical protein